MIQEMCSHCEREMLALHENWLMGYKQHIALCIDCYFSLDIPNLVAKKIIIGNGMFTDGGKGRFWVTDKNVEYIKSIPKKFGAVQKAAPVKKDDSKIIASAMPVVAAQFSVCPRKYHGLPNCTCGKCPKPSFAAANKNVFGYTK